MTNTIKISEPIQAKIRKNFIKNITDNDNGYFFFRRVERYFGINEPVIYKYSSPGKYHEISREEYEKLTPEERLRYINIKYRNFTAKTRANPIRDDKFDGINIYLTKYTYSEIDVSKNFTFEFGDHRKYGAPCTPIPNDLIFGYISKDTYNNYKEKHNDDPKFQLRADKWFIASEQFLRAWTLIVNGNDDISVKVPAKYIGTDEYDVVLRKKRFQSSRLMTNTLLKRQILQLEKSGKPLSEEEVDDLFWFNRTEFVSRQWVDVWACMVTMLTYGEIPCYFNRMIAYDSEVQRPRWNIPDDLVRMFFVRFADDIETKDLIGYDEYIKSVNLDSKKLFFENITSIVFNVPQCNM